ncbi:MAG: UDP-3-O-[3-hydroxymyristoyl] N-acetylglucosamine deacetylase [Gemmatimonadales bacterium]|nr:MAG: UDP-3-O-[3-hydroxymyristoyl] N-acetylglucosamine deacetylase [Gemmatimonadales bacterium]
MSTQAPGRAADIHSRSELLRLIMIGPEHRTPAGPVTLSGIGVHTGKPSTVTILPAEVGTGIRFVRTDLPDANEIPARLESVLGTDLGTTIGHDDVNRVLTVEHLMAGLSAAGISTARVEIDGAEPPILDGSFLPYLQALLDVGTRTLEGEVPVIRVRKPLHLDAGEGTSYVVTPGSGLRVAGAIEFDHPAVGRQFGSFELTPETFLEEIAAARTFGFEDQAEALRSRGLAQGSSLENTVVIGQDGVMNDGLRFSDEFLRHKIGDLVGDLALLGARFEGQILIERPSHAGNVALARKLEIESRRSGEGDAIVDAQKILQYLPHRYPMLLVDRVTHFEPGRRIVGVKNVTINEPFFQGHYPGHPIMPGVLIIEAMAQVGGLLLMDTIENPDEKVVYFMSLNNVKWRRPVTPGDQIIFELELLQFRRSICKMRGEGFVDGALVAEAELMARVVDR